MIIVGFVVDLWVWRQVVYIPWFGRWQYGYTISFV